jgi:hypothetical protein
MATMGSGFVIANAANLPISGYSNSGGGIIQTVYTHFTTPATQALTANVANNIYSINITPFSASSGVIIYARWSGEVPALWDAMWGLNRGTTYITNPGNTPGTRNIGVLPGGDSYAAAADNDASTPAMVDFWWMDFPSTTSTTTYFLTCRPAAARTLYLNRTVSDTNAAGFERMTSAMMIWEVSR